MYKVEISGVTGNVTALEPNFDEDEFKYPVGRKNECETCGRHGFVLKRYQHPQLINPAETKCPDCRGTGEIE